MTSKKSRKLPSADPAAQTRSLLRQQTLTCPISGGDIFNPTDGVVADGPGVLQPSKLFWRDDARGLCLYHGDCFGVMDSILQKHPDGCFDMIFADPPYFLSNGGITCHAGRMVKVDKGEWDKSRGPEENHNFNREWLRRCRDLLKPNGTLWVSGTHHVIFSVGHAMQELGMKILNQITWEKPNPPPNLSCRHFTHSTETVLWAAKSEQSKHIFHYDVMRQTNGGKQMKDVWRPQFDPDREIPHGNGEPGQGNNEGPRRDALASVWALSAPRHDEKAFGKHPTQKPIALLERIILASTDPSGLVLDPFLGSGTTLMAAAKLGRRAVGIESAETYIALARKRLAAAPAVGATTAS
ncbi:MAG: site-specific DNA-methyltransferase [Opitutaceae bacterium]|nr:site-specific DNA-methyltransferase [Opitutaceae bacterium]